MNFRIARKETDPDYGRGSHSIDEDDEVLLDGDALVERVLETFVSPGYEPPMLPTVAIELMSLSQKPDVAIRDMAKLLEREPMLAARVMKRVQSPMFAGAARISSLKDAIVRLGISGLRDVVWEVALNMRVFKVEGYTESMEFLRRHCTATAYIARIICQYTSMEGEYAFICGLLHDVGVAATMIALADGAKKARRPVPDLIGLWPAIDRGHEKASATLVKLWGLPPDFQYVVGAHHTVFFDGYPHPLAATICLAEHIASEFGRGMLPSKDTPDQAKSLANQLAIPVDTTPPRLVVKAAQAIKINKKILQLIRTDVSAVFDQI